MQYAGDALRAPGGNSGRCASARDGRHHGRDNLRSEGRTEWPATRLGIAGLLACCLAMVAPAESAEPAAQTAAAHAGTDGASQGTNWDEIRVQVVEQGNSTRRVRRTALEELPLDRLSPESRRLADAVLNALSLHRRLPVVDCETDPRILQFFITHPDVAVAIWQAMEITEMQLKPLGGGRYASDTGDGTTGVITVLYGDEREQLIHCSGVFKSPVLARPIEAAALMHLQADYSQPGSPRDVARCRVDVFVSFPSTAIETAVRVISPVSNRIADRNFEEVAMFVRMMHLAMTRQPGWVEQTSARLPDVPVERREQLLDLTAAVYVDHQRRITRNEQQTLTPEGLRLPIRREPGVEAAAPTRSAGATTPAAEAFRPLLR